MAVNFQKIEFVIPGGIYPDVHCKGFHRGGLVVAKPYKSWGIYTLAGISVYNPRRIQMRNLRMKEVKAIALKLLELPIRWKGDEMELHYDVKSQIDEIKACYE